MEGVGARLGRSSSRYGTTTVFSGPVRKWKKDWVPINPSSSSSSSSSTHHNSNHNHHNHSSSNGSLNGTNGSVSHLRLYKWTPLSKENNNNPNSKSNDIDNKISDNIDNDSPSKGPAKDDVVSEEPPRRKFKYIPIAVLEEQKKETEENTDDEAKPIDADEIGGGQPSKSDGDNEKPDINDVPMEENQDTEEKQTAPTRQDLNELDLSLGLTSHDEEHDSDSKTDPNEDGQTQPERSKSESVGV